MKSGKKLTIITLILTMLVFGSISAQAAEKIVYKQLKPGQTVTQNYFTYDDDDYNAIWTYYYFSVPSPGLVTFTLDNVDISLYRSKYKPTLKDSNDYFAYSYDDKKVTYALDRGTYYLRVEAEGGSKAKCKAKYSFKKAAFAKNYCASKAAKLGKIKTVQIAQTPKNHYVRWYKIVLKKKQAITYFTNDGDIVNIYDDDMENIETERAGAESSRYFTKTKLAKGTYYAKVSYNYYDIRSGKGYITFKWQ